MRSTSVLPMLTCNLRIFMNKLRNIAFTLSLLTVAPAAAQEPDSVWVDSVSTVAHRIAFDAVPSTIFHTNEFLRGGNDETRTMNHDMTFTLKYAFMNRDEVRLDPSITVHTKVWAWQGMSLTAGSQTPSLCSCFRERPS